MSVPFLDLRRELSRVRQEVDEAVTRVLDSGVFVLGAEVEAFELEFASYCGVDHAIGVASGTDAITIALRAAGISPGDEVITAANTCVPTVSGIEAAGAIPVLADVNLQTCTLSPESVASAVTKRTHAIVAVHLYGRLADMAALGEIARRRGLVLVEDAAQAHGAAFAGRRAGGLGDVAAFSFYPTKNLGALGDAGAVLTNDATVAQRARQLRAYGERERYESVLHGWNSRLDPIQAAVLRVRLPRLDDANRRRAEVARRYADLLGDVPTLQLPAEGCRGAHAYHLFALRVADRGALRTRLAARGVQTLVHYPIPIHQHPAYSKLSRSPTGLVASEQLSREVLSLPLYPGIEDAEVDLVASSVRAELA